MSAQWGKADIFFQKTDKGFYTKIIGKKSLFEKFEIKKVRGDGACLFRAVGELVNQLHEQIIERVQKAIPRLKIEGTFAPFKSGAKTYDALTLPTPNNQKVYMTKELMNQHFKTDTMPKSQWYLGLLNHLDGVQVLDDEFVNITAHALGYSIVEYQYKDSTINPEYYHNDETVKPRIYLLLKDGHYYPLRLVTGVPPPVKGEWFLAIESPNLAKNDGTSADWHDAPGEPLAYLKWLATNDKALATLRQDRIDNPNRSIVQPLFDLMSQPPAAGQRVSGAAIKTGVVLQGTGYNIGAIETGGGGDCLYYSIRAALEDIEASGGKSFIDDIDRKYKGVVLGGGVLAGDARNRAKNIRLILGKEIENMPNVQFITRFLKLYQKFITRDTGKDAWNEGWNFQQIARFPNNKILLPNENEFNESIKNSSNVEIKENPVGPEGHRTGTTPMLDQDDQGNVTATYVIGDEGLESTLTLSNNYITNLKKNLAREFEQMGNHHWGEMIDIEVLSEALNVGMIIIVSNGTIICPYTKMNDKSYYMILYNQKGVHYQLGALLGAPQKEGEILTVFTSETMPDAIKTWYSKQKCQFPLK